MGVTNVADTRIEDLGKDLNPLGAVDSDHYPINGKPLDDADVKRGEQGTQFDWAGWPSNVNLMGDIATQFPDRLWVDLMDEMLKKDGQAEAVLTALTMPIRMAGYQIEPSKGDKGEAELATEALTRHQVEGGMQTSLNRVIAQMTQARAYRLSFHEVVWTRGKIGDRDCDLYKKLAWRPAVSCHLKRHRITGDITGFAQWQDPERQVNFDLDDEGYVLIEANRAVVYVHNPHRDPLYGKSDMDVILWAHTLKMKVLQWWANYCDRMGIPKTIVYGKTLTEARNNAARIAKLGSAGVVAVERKGGPDEPLFEVLDNSGGGTATQVFKLLVDYLDGMMSRSVLASWLDLPSAAGNGAGSYALSADQSGIFMQTLFATAGDIAELITCRIIAPLVRRNFGPKAAVPKFKFNKIDTEQIDKILGLIDTVLAAQNGPQLPQKVFHMLLRKVASYVDLDVDEVQKILDEEPDLPTAPEQTPAEDGAAAAGAEGAPPVDESGAAPAVDSGAAGDGPDALAAKLAEAGVKV
jgi:hypothetical protein